MTVITINDVALTAFFDDPAGGVSRFMGTVVAPDVLAAAREFISRPFPGHGSRGARFPPPGPPYLRSGDLREGLQVVSAPSPLGGVEYDIVPTAVHRGANYGLILQQRGYRFLPDSFYV